MLVHDKINEIAKEMYRLSGYTVRDDFDFLEATHPQEKIALAQAMSAWEIILGDTPDLEAEWDLKAE